MFNLELDKAASHLNKGDKVCIQLPEGLKPKAKEIADYLEDKSGAKVIIWAGSCFGSCDVPKIKGIDLLIQWGHSEFIR